MCMCIYIYIYIYINTHTYKQNISSISDVYTSLACGNSLYIYIYTHTYLYRPAQLSAMCTLPWLVEIVFAALKRPQSAAWCGPEDLTYCICVF